MSVNQRFFDVVIIGSGPAGVAVAERLYEKHPTATIAVVERGPVLLRQHFYDSRRSIDERDRFLAEHGDCPWEGDLSRGGRLLPCLGGRGIVGGGQLHRFYEQDFTLWREGVWGVGPAALDPYFTEAEKRLLGSTRSAGPSQDFTCSVLAEFNARHPPHGPNPEAARGIEGGYPHRSSAERILRLLARDRASRKRRLSVFTETVVVKLDASRSRTSRVNKIRCVRQRDGKESDLAIHGAVFVLAASPVESARLVMVSEIAEAPSESSPVGRYLAEHIYCRGYLDVSHKPELRHGPVNVYVPPLGSGLDDRYQIEIRSAAHPDDNRFLLRVTGSAAMDPRRENRVRVSLSRVDAHGVARAITELARSPDDERRTMSMISLMNHVASSFGSRWLVPPRPLPCGASYHEVGTLRISAAYQESAAAMNGLLLGTENVFVGDGAAFASVGTANPILTLTAMGYRLADGLVRRLDSES